MWGAGPDPAVVGSMAQAAVELTPCGKGHPFGEEGTANPEQRTTQQDAESWAAPWS